MEMKHRFLWLTMKFWQWRNGGPAPNDVVDMLLLRYNTENKRQYEEEHTSIQCNDRSDDEFFRDLAKRHIARRLHLEKFVSGFQKTATTTASKAAIAEVYWIIEASMPNWGITLTEVRDCRVWRQTTMHEIRRLGRRDRVELGLAPWHEHVHHWYDSLVHRRHK